MTESDASKVVESLEIPVWDGNREKLPELWKMFIYKKKYMLLKLNGVFVVLNTETGKGSKSMEVRMFGAASDILIANAIIKAGIATIDEMADAYENRTVPSLVQKFGELLEKQSDKQTKKFLEAKGITDKEFSDITQCLALKALREVFEALDDLDDLLS